MRRRSVLPAIPLICLTAILLCACYGCNARPARSSNPDVIKSAMGEFRKTFDRVKSGRGSCEHTLLEAKAGKKESYSSKYKGAFDGDRFRVSVLYGDGLSAKKTEVGSDGMTLTYWEKSNPQPPGYYSTRIGRKDLTDFFAGHVNPIKQTERLFTGLRGIKDLSHMKAAGYEALNGDRCLVIDEGGGEEPTGKWWLDVEKGYLPVKHQIFEERESGKLTPYLDERFDIRDYGNGLWAPSKVVTIFYDEEGKMASQNTLVYSKDLKLNVPIGPKELELKIPAGVKKHE